MNIYTVEFIDHMTGESHSKTVKANSPCGAIMVAVEGKTSYSTTYIKRDNINVLERLRMVKAMEYICRQINDMDVFDGWLMGGVADGDIRYGDLTDDGLEYLEYYIEDDKVFADLMGCFLRRMARAKKSGGLYCDGVIDSSEEG